METIVNIFKAIWNSFGETTKLVIGILPSVFVFFALAECFGETVKMVTLWILLVACIIFLVLYTAALILYYIDEQEKKNLRN